VFEVCLCAHGTHGDQTSWAFLPVAPTGLAWKNREKGAGPVEALCVDGERAIVRHQQGGLVSKPLPSGGLAERLVASAASRASLVPDFH
jgi:hypothetical protein